MKFLRLKNRVGKSDVDIANSEANVHVELAELTSFLQLRAIEAIDFDQVKRQVDEKRKAHLEQRLMGLRAVKLPAWIFLRNPLWGAWFVLRNLSTQRQAPSWTLVHQLDQLLGRAEFSRRLSQHVSEKLRALIQENEISAWGALTLVRGTGCSITEEGLLVPNPIGKFGLMIGSLVCALLVLLLSMLVDQLLVQVSMECPISCVTQGLLIMMQWTGLFLVLAFSITWGRHRGAARLRRLLV